LRRITGGGKWERNLRKDIGKERRGNLNQEKLQRGFTPTEMRKNFEVNSKRRKPG